MISCPHYDIPLTYVSVSTTQGCKRGLCIMTSLYVYNFIVATSRNLWLSDGAKFLAPIGNLVYRNQQLILFQLQQSLKMLT